VFSSPFVKRTGEAIFLVSKSLRGYVAIGIAIWFAFQTAVNIGAASGIAPTKGLTLPLLRYGGSSLLSISIGIGLLLRIDFETRKIASPVRFTKGEENTADKNERAEADIVERKANGL
jgi:cell division protein FtsW